MTEKKWLKIGETAKLLGLSPKELRYWESVIPEIRPRRSKGNLRYYHREELPRLERIRDWLEEGLTVADCQQLLVTGQLKRGLGMEIQAQTPMAVPPPKTKAPPQVSPRIEQARQALASLLERLASVPRPAPRKRRRAEPKVPAEESAPAHPAPPAPKPARSRKKPAPEPGDPDSFGPLFDQGR
jgi:DNA-binding transcriptional MerR regulator